MYSCFVYTDLNVKIVPFLTIQFTNLQFKCQTVLFLLIDRTLSGATYLAQSRPGSSGYKREFHISAKLMHYWSLTVK